MTRRLSSCAVPIVLLLAAVSAATAQTGAPAPERIYRLAPESAFEEGCFDPCMCIMHFYDGLLGTLRLVPAPPEPGFAVFAVRDVNWLVPGLDYFVTGSGTYRVGGQPLMHRLELDLMVADREAQHYDSGLALVGPGTVGFAITISMNNMVCRDTVFHVVARPIATKEIADYTLYRSSHQEGCFGGCDCPVTMQPLSGRIGLLALSPNTAAAADFAVLNFKGMVSDPASVNGGWPVDGVGIYRTGLAAGERRMRLAISEDGRPPVRFDSGVIPGDPSLRRLDIDVAENGFACYDRVYSIHGRRRPSSLTLSQAYAPPPLWPTTPAP